MVSMEPAKPHRSDAGGGEALTANPQPLGCGFFASHRVSDLASQDDVWLEAQGRLVHPLRYDAGTDRFELITWTQAMERIAQALRGLDHPDQAVFCTCGPTSNEAAFLYQLLGRSLGTNNFPGCLCFQAACPPEPAAGQLAMGLTPLPATEFLLRLGQIFSFLPPAHPGFDGLAAARAMAAGRVRVLIGLGGEVAAATRHGHDTDAGLRQCPLAVHIAATLRRHHVVHGQEAIILPCLDRAEMDWQRSGLQCVSMQDPMGRVRRMQGTRQPISSYLWSEPAILAGIARAAMPDSLIAWEWMIEDYSRIREMIAAVVPAYYDYNRRLLEPGGFRAGHMEAPESGLHSLSPGRLAARWRRLWA